MKILQVNDLHLSDRPPSKRTASYTDDIFAKLNEISGLVKEYRVQAVVCTGDVFHQKYAFRVSHALTNRIAAWVQSLGVEFVLIPGNHDIRDNNLDSLWKQPISALRLLDNVTYMEDMIPMRWHDFLVFPIPGVVLGEKDVPMIAGLDVLREEADGRQTIIIGHLPLVLDDKWYPFETLKAKDFVGKADLVMWGHKHDPDKVITLLGDNGQTTLFSNPGAISRGTLSASDMQRTPAVALIDIDGGKAKARYLKLDCVRPVEDVFLLDGVEFKEEREEAMEDFLENLQGSRMEMVTRDGLLAEVQKADVDEGVRKLATEILEEVE